MIAYITGRKPESPRDKGTQKIGKCRMAILDDDVFFHAVLFLYICNNPDNLSEIAVIATILLFHLQ